MLRKPPGQDGFLCFFALLMLHRWICIWLNSPHAEPASLSAAVLCSCHKLYKKLVFFSQSGALKNICLCFSKQWVWCCSWVSPRELDRTKLPGPIRGQINFGRKQLCCSLSHFTLRCLGMQLLKNLKPKIKISVLFANFSPCEKSVNTNICNRVKRCSWDYIDFFISENKIQ